MGVSNTPVNAATPAAVLSSVSPEIRIEQASDDGDDEDRVFLEGTMFHDGMNSNAWGLTKEGAQVIANDLVGTDHIAAHPPIRNGKYDRSMTDGPGFPIGRVASADVVEVDSAMLDGGEYTASYISEITDPIYKARYKTGQYDNENFSVSIGIYGDKDQAECSVCGQQMASDDCDHDRFDEVKVESDDGETETQIAGPLFNDGQSDHLASVYFPAYEGAEANVDTSSVEATASGGLEAASEAGNVPTAASVLAEPFDASTDPEQNPESETSDESGQTPVERDGYQVQVAGGLPERGTRDSYRVRLDNERE